MIITTTQVSSFQDCPLKWYIHKVLKVPDLWTRNYLFGSVLHACLERWYKACGTGIVPEHSDTWENGGPLFLQEPGDKVELFPEGWEWHKDRDGSWDRLTDEESIRVRAAVEMGFEEGTADAPEDAIIEKAFKIAVIDGVDLVSLADCLSLIRVEIQDHKSSSALHWLKTPEELSKNLQLIIYAMYLIQLYLEKFGEEPETVLMRHNGYIKKAPFKTHVRYAEIDGNKHIPVSHVKEVWKEVQEIARQMVEVSQLPIEEVPKTKDRKICSKYSGCPYKPHCHMHVGLDVVAKSITAQNKRAHTLTAMEQPPIPGQATAPEPSISPPSGKPEFLKPHVEVGTEWPRAKSLKDGTTVWQKAPFSWGQPGCGICKGSGAHQKSYCPSCVENYDGPLAAPFLEIVEGGQGSQWLREGKEEPEVESPTIEELLDASVAPLEEDLGEQIAAAGKAMGLHEGVLEESGGTMTVTIGEAEPTPEIEAPSEVIPEEVAPVEETPEPEAVVEEKPVEKKRGRGRPKKEEEVSKEPIDIALQSLTKQKISESFTLCIGCGASSKKRPIIALAPVLEAAKIEIARRCSVSDFYEVVDSKGMPWMRREQLAQLSPWIIQQLVGKVVTFYGQDDPEVQGVLARIEAAASEVYRA